MNHAMNRRSPRETSPSLPPRLRRGAVLLTALLLLPLVPTNARDALDALPENVLALYLDLAEACRDAYDDDRPGLVQTPTGCVALIRDYGNRDRIVAFRGSMLADRTPEHPFSSFGGANIRRGYRDWVATNLKQTAGFLPRQYVEAAELVAREAGRLPEGGRLYVTGHSKGGGAAAYAYVAAATDPAVLPERADRIRCVTFNAAVVRERNWRRLFRTRRASAAEPAAGSIVSLCMRDDPVSRIAAGEERAYVRRLVIRPSSEMSPGEQHGIASVIAELLARTATPSRR